MHWLYPIEIFTLDTTPYTLYHYKTRKNMPRFCQSNSWMGDDKINMQHLITQGIRVMFIWIHAYRKQQNNQVCALEHATDTVAKRGIIARCFNYLVNGSDKCFVFVCMWAACNQRHNGEIWDVCVLCTVSDTAAKCLLWVYISHHFCITRSDIQRFSDYYCFFIQLLIKWNSLAQM